jgi:hypothetical protein
MPVDKLAFMIYEVQADLAGWNPVVEKEAVEGLK